MHMMSEKKNPSMTDYKKNISYVRIWECRLTHNDTELSGMGMEVPEGT